jgi:hypothetical protein
MDDSIMMEHFGVNWCGLSDEANEVSEVSVADVDHGSDGENEWLGVVAGCGGSLFLHLL